MASGRGQINPRIDGTKAGKILPVRGITMGWCDCYALLVNPLVLGGMLHALIHVPVSWPTGRVPPPESLQGFLGRRCASLSK